METEYLIYIAKVNAALLLFFGLYFAILRRDTFMRMRRYFLLSAILFSLIYPLVSINGLGDIFAAFQSAKPQTAQVVVEMGQPGSVVMLAETDAPRAIHIPWEAVGLGLWALGTAFFAVRFCWQLFSIIKIRRESQAKEVFGYRIYDLKQEMTPFSFFGWIFVNTQSHSDKELRQILLHEHTHARQWHSADVVLSEILCILFWWNPAVWLIKREIAINLEYLADNDVLQHGINSKEYQYHLLKLTYHETAVQIVNNFNVSQLKQRIMMMNKSKSSSKQLAKYLTILPLAFLLIATNSAYGQKKETTKDPNFKKKAEQLIKKKTSAAASDDVFMVVEKQPEFPGGNAGMNKFLGNNIKYPVEAQTNGIQGRVIVNFIVEKDGSLSDFQVVRGVDPLLDAEAVRVIKLMPKWKPAEQRGQKVRVRYTLPVTFRLQGDKTSVPPPPPPPPAYTKSADELKNTDEVFIVVENQPEFPGGIDAMMKFLGDNIKYPVEAQKKGIQGRVIVNFIVRKDGSISDARIVRGVDPNLDAEAIRVIESMPKWKPGTQRGEKVNVRFTLPVSFRLFGDTKKEQEDAMQVIKTEEAERRAVVQKEFQQNRPQFPGGEGAYMKYLADNIKYPVIAQENGIQGLVRASFAIDKNGKVHNVKIDKGADPSLDKEVVRLLNSMPNWEIPNKEKFGAAFETLPVVFRLQGDGVSTYKGETPKNALVVTGYAVEKKSTIVH